MHKVKQKAEATASANKGKDSMRGRRGGMSHRLSPAATN